MFSARGLNLPHFFLFSPSHHSFLLVPCQPHQCFNVQKYVYGITLWATSSLRICATSDAARFRPCETIARKIHMSPGQIFTAANYTQESALFLGEMHIGLVSRIIRDRDSVLLYVVKVTGSSGRIGTVSKSIHYGKWMISAHPFA